MSQLFEKPDRPKSSIDPKTLVIRPTAAIQYPARPAMESLLDALWRHADQCHLLGEFDRATKQYRNIAIESIDAAIEQATKISNAGKEAYFACAEYQSPNSRKADNVAGASAFWLDVDCGTGKRYATVAEARAAVQEFCTTAGVPVPTHLVASGTGLHCYWAIAQFIDRETWQTCARNFKALTEKLDLAADPSRTADIASVLRLPGTKNRKYQPPAEVKLIDASADRIELSAWQSAIAQAMTKFVPVRVLDDQAAPAATIAMSSTDFYLADLDRLASALACLDPDCDESTWKLKRLAPLARLAAMHTEFAPKLHELARDFSSGKLRGRESNAWTTPGSTNGRTGQEIFDQVWQRFMNEDSADRPITIATIFKDATNAGWVDERGEKFVVADYEVVGDARTSGVGGQVEVSAELSILQGQYALIKIGGKVWVNDRAGAAAMTETGTANKLVFYNRGDATLLLTRTLRKAFPASNAYTTVVKDFFVHPDTICYDGLEFNPKATTGNFLNLWVGPTITSVKGDWAGIKEFLLTVICDGHEAHYAYLIHYIAHALQRPWEKPGIALILIGGQGIGKGTLGRIFRAIWQATYLHVYKTANVTGSFNADLERAFIVFLDEALFAGDRASSDALKSLVTEEVIHINEKHQPSRQINSYHRFVIATNADHVKHTDRDDRRDFVLRVSEARKGDHEYWKTLSHEIDHGGVAAMAHDLLALDLSGFNVRAKPETGELVEQKLLSLDVLGRYWHELLLGPDGGEDGWPDFISTESIIQGALDLAGSRVYRKPSASEAVKAVQKMCPSATKGQKQDNHHRARGVLLPDQKVARAEFEAFIGGAVKWD